MRFNRAQRLLEDLVGDKLHGLEYPIRQIENNLLRVLSMLRTASSEAEAHVRLRELQRDICSTVGFMFGFDHSGPNCFS